MKKIFSVLLALCLLAACLPFSASAAVESYHVYVGSVEVTSANASGVTGTNISGKVTYDPASRTLTLENAAVNGRPNDGVTSGAAIFANGDLKIRTVGVNTVNGGSFEKQSYGIACMESLTFEGDGALKVTVPEEDYITAIVTKNGALTVNSGTVEAVTGDGTYLSIAIHSGNGVIVNGGVLTAAGGTTYETYGIYSAKNGVKVYGGTVTASAGDFGKKSAGLYCENSGKLVISGGTVTARSPGYASNCVPDVSGYPGELVEASVSESGTPLDAPYSADKISDYKYLKVSRAPLSFAEVEITGVDAPVTGQPLKKTFTVPEGITLVSVSWDPDDTVAKARTEYTVTVDLKTEGAASFAADVKPAFNGAAGKVVSAGSTQLKASFTFPETGAEAATAFSDVPAGSYYEKPVAWAVGKDVTSGVGDGKFGSANICRRCEVVTFLWKAAGKPEPSSLENPFSDVAASDYFYKAVLWAVEKNITSGVGSGRFDPKGTCKRNQIVTFLWNYKGNPDPVGTAGFTDVPAGCWYESSVAWAKENDITSGVGGGKFGSNDPCKRRDVMTFLWKAEGKPE